MSDDRKYKGRLAVSITFVLDPRSAPPPCDSVIIAAPSAILVASAAPAEGVRAPIEIGKKSVVATEAHTSKAIVLVLSCSAQFMVVLDIAIVNVALPSIQQDLGIGQSTLQWIEIAYGLILGGFLLLGGTIGNTRAVSRLA